MIAQEDKAWCALAGLRGVGPKALWSIAGYLTAEGKTASWLLQHPDAMEAALDGRLTRVLNSALTIDEPEEVDDVGENQVTVLHPLHPDFPKRVKSLKDTFSLPALLYTRGNTAIFRRLGVAIIGARHAGDPAILAADRLASELAAKGVNVTSGYAKGIDAAAHLAALRDGGTTSIVLSEGINGFRLKRELGELSAEDNTLVISQFEPDAPWAAHSAMIRNELICALSSCVIVIVSGPERSADGRVSGTFDAGATALQMGIPLFVVSPQYFEDEPEGNRQLLAKGGREWNPSDGGVPILSAIQEENPSNSKRSVAKTKRSKTRQLALFEKGQVKD